MDCRRPIVAGLVLALTPAGWAQTDMAEAQRVLEIVESGHGVLLPLEGALAPPESEPPAETETTTEPAADPLLDQFEEAEEIASSEEMIETEDEMSDDVSAMVETADADDAETMAETVDDDVDTMVEEAAVTEEMALIETTTLPEPPAEDAVDSRTVELGDPESIGPNRLWLGSFRNKSEAQERWDQLAKDHPDILGNLVPILVFKSLGTDEGAFFRLQAGSLQSEGEANDACAALQAAPSFCTVLGP